MTYDQTNSLFEAMDNLETYSKLHQLELSRDECDWDAIQRYRDNIKVARKTIFSLAGGSND
jgi:hypothetical protein